MARSVKKGPFVQEALVKKVETLDPQPDGIHVQEERRRAAILLRLRVEDVRLPERQVE